MNYFSHILLDFVLDFVMFLGHLPSEAKSGGHFRQRPRDALPLQTGRQGRDLHGTRTFTTGMHGDTM